MYSKHYKCVGLQNLRRKELRSKEDAFKFYIDIFKSYGGYSNVNKDIEVLKNYLHIKFKDQLEILSYVFKKIINYNLGITKDKDIDRETEYEFLSQKKKLLADKTFTI